MSIDDQRLIGQSANFLAVLQQASQLAQLDKPVLIVGERGTGKELFAERIHYLSRRWEKAYLQMNCAAVTEGLMESELFGHEAGAFTGALRRHPGRFERAEGGTLFLDELASTSARVQEKLLRIVEYGTFERLGGREVLRVDVRLLAASNEDLPLLADEGGFRHDLLDRLSFDVITLPPLREREEDILLLAEHFAARMTGELGYAVFPGFAPQARDLLLDWAWPGNVRELKNAVERSLYRHEDWERPITKILIDPFESPFRAGLRARLVKAPAEQAVAPRAPQITAIPADLRAFLSNQEAQLIRQALVQTQFNQRRAAARLGLSYHQLRASIKRLHITPGAEIGGPNQ